jgi:hypothetical protein
MRLHIEDEIGRALLLGKGCRFKQFDLSNVKELPKDRVHGQQRGCHPAGRLEKVSTRETSSNYSPFHERGRELFNASLSCGLAEGGEFFVRHDLRRNGGLKCGPFPSRGNVWKW